jgi:hypothetical protein
MNHPEKVPARDITLVRPPASGGEYTILVEIPPETPPRVAGTLSGKKGIRLDNDVVQALTEEFGYSRDLLLIELRAFDNMSPDLDEKVYYGDDLFL